MRKWVYGLHPFPFFFGKVDKAINIVNNVQML